MGPLNGTVSLKTNLSWKGVHLRLRHSNYTQSLAANKEVLNSNKNWGVFSLQMLNGSKTAEWHGFSTGSRRRIDRRWREPPLPTGISNSVSRARPSKTRAAADRRRCRSLAWWASTRSTRRGSGDRECSSESGSSSSRARKQKRGKKKSWKVSPPTLYMNAIQTHTVSKLTKSVLPPL